MQKCNRIGRIAFAVLGCFFAARTLLAQIPTSVAYVQGHRCVVVSPAGLPDGAPVVLILHGYGTNGDELLGLANRLALPPCLFVLPDGPLPTSHFNSVNHAWYNRFTHDRGDIERSRDYLFAVMDHFSRDTQSPGPRPVVIMGFSQGAVMSLEAGVNYKGRIAAVVSMSGYMGEPARTLAHPHAPRRTPILLVHGTRDPVVQEEATQETLAALRRAGYRPVLREFPVGHQMTGATLQAVSRFLQAVLARNH